MAATFGRGAGFGRIKSVMQLFERPQTLGIAFMLYSVRRAILFAAWRAILEEENEKTLYPCNGHGVVDVDHVAQRAGFCPNRARLRYG